MNVFKVLCSSLCLMFALISAGYGDEHFPFLGEVSRGPVNVRAGANTNYEAVEKLDKGQELVVLAKNYEWYKVQLPASAAVYIRADYVKELEQSMGELTGNKVNVRAKPNSESSTLGQVLKGDFVKLVEKTNDWWKIVPPAGSVGWVHKDFVSVKSQDVPEASLRKPLTAPVAVVVKPIEVPVLSIDGTLKPLTDPTIPDAHYQILVDDKPTYYLKDAPHLDRFDGAPVRVEGTAADDAKNAYPTLHIKKISLVL